MSPEARAARERKQKIFVVVGGLLLVALLAFQLPKLLGGSSSPEAAGTETTSTVPGQATGAPAGTSTPPVAGSTTPPAHPTTVAATSKLSSFSAFRPKDPFVQQVVTGSSVDGAGSAVASGDAAKAAKGAKGAGAGATTKFSTAAKAGASATIVTVNGVRQVVVPGMRFPAADPLFVLVAEKPEAKAIVVGIVGGAYSGGQRATTLKVGKPLTLVNTTTGARYKISLVSVGSGEQAEQPKAKE
jgi:hypothetical protein